MRYAVKLSTYACYETLLDTHILPEFGDTPLKYISSASVYASPKAETSGAFATYDQKSSDPVPTVFYAMVRSRVI